MALTLDFAFEGFRILRARPKLIVLWGIVTLLGNGIAMALLIAMAGPALENLLGLVRQGNVGDPARMVQDMNQIWPALPGFAGVSLVTTAILNAAACRAAFGEEEDGLGFLRFGARELQLIVVLFVTRLIQLGAIIACAVVSTLAAAVVSSVDSAATLMLSAGMVGAGILVLWLQVRLSFNVARTFAEKRIAIFDSFAMTKEPFWTLLWGSLLAWGLAMVVMFLGAQVVDAIVGVSFGAADTVQAAQPDMTSLAAFMTPQTLMIFGLTYAFVSPQILAIELAAPIAAYRTVSGKTPTAQIEEVF